MTDRYAVLLRGVNFGGRNTVSMATLKTACEGAGFGNVKTYINSGNIMLDSDLSEDEIAAACRALIEREFDLAIPVAVVSRGELREALSNAPKWWCDEPEAVHNAVFVVPPANPQIIFQQILDAKYETEKVALHGKVIFWTAPRENHYKTGCAKVIYGKAVSDSVTIRNANTTKKLAELMA
jgi:uncharacterized protein (DUF1697 family)